MDMFMSSISKSTKAGLEHTNAWRKKGYGYFLEQATKPQTLGYSLSDSPVGLLAWIYEKLIGWTDNYPWTEDEGKHKLALWIIITHLGMHAVIEWISIYWFSRAGPAAAGRIYYEMTGCNTHDPWHGTKWTSIPTGASYFPCELVHLPHT